MDKLQDTELAYLKLLLEALRAAQGAYNQYAAYLGGRYQMTENDQLKMETGEIVRAEKKDEE